MKKINLKKITMVAGALLACCCVTVNAQEKTPSLRQAQDRPNVVFILADDLGITDVAAFASHFTGKKTDELFYETPHLDKLVSQGIAFSQAYANPLCSPTRASILTGKNAARSGFTTATPKTGTYHNKKMPVPEGPLLPAYDSQR